MLIEIVTTIFNAMSYLGGILAFLFVVLWVITALMVSDDEDEEDEEE